MDTDRNLLFGVLALQADLIDAPQFVEACTLWAARKDVPLAELLIERGWILPADREHVDYLLRRKLHKHGNDIRASLATVGDDIKRSLAAVEDADIRRSLAELPRAEAPDLAATVDHIAGPCPRYTRTCLHAVGGLGRVWLARDRDLGRDVALKEIRPERGGDAALHARFLQEARITGQLEHPGVVPVYELGRGPDDQQPFYTMRFVKGRTLSEAARTYHDKRLAGQADALALLTLLNAFVAVCNTVAYAHARGVLHRDLKGQNVVLGDFGEVVVLDWGLAKLVNRPAGEESRSLILADPEESGEGDLTVQGQTVGTPAYMAPEQAAGRPDLIDRHTDVYGLGAILYEILTGQPPFRGSNTEEVLRKVREEEPMPPRQLWAEVPSAVEAICLRALAKRPEDRYASATELAQEVQHWMVESAERKQADQQRARFFALSLDLMCIAGFDGYFKKLNPAWQQSLGWTIEELQAKPWIEFIHPDDIAPTLAATQRLIEGGIVLLHENRYRCKDGSYRWLQWTAQEIVGEHLIYAVARDITDRKLAEEELRKSRERFELAVLGSQDGLWDWDVEANQVWYSPQMRSMLGYDEEEFPNRPGETEKRVHPDDHARWRATLHGHVTGVTDHLEMEYRMLHKDGSYRWVRDRGVALRRADGKAYRIAGSREDITARKRFEEELTHERYLLRSLMDTVPDKIYFKDRESRFIRVNKDLAENFGLADATEALGKTDADFFTPEHAEQARADECEILRTGRPIVAKEEKEIWFDGRVTWASTTKLPLRDPQGRIIGTFGVSRDITQRKQSELALRESEERYRSVIAAMQDGIVLLDTDGSIRACNDSAERILGLSADQMMGRTPSDPRWRAIHEDGSPFPGETHPPMVTLRTGQPCSNVIMGVHKPDGTLTWISINSQPLLRADGTTLCGVAASFEDITDRKHVEELLRRTVAELTELKERWQGRNESERLAGQSR